MQEEEKQVDNEEVIAVKTVKTLDQLTEALNRDGCNFKKNHLCTSVSLPNMEEQEKGNNM